jgi:hypothetical protein
MFGLAAPKAIDDIGVMSSSAGIAAKSFIFMSFL